MKYGYLLLAILVVGIVGFMVHTKSARKTIDHPVVRGSTPLPANELTSAMSPVPLQFTPIPNWTYLNPASDQYDVYKKVRHAVRTDPEGKVEILVDEISDTAGAGDNKTFHYKLLYNGKILADKDINDKDMTELLPDSHVFIAKFPPKNNQFQNPANAKKAEEYDMPVAFLAFKRKSGMNGCRIIGITGNMDQSSAWNMTASNYEFSKTDNDPNEEIVIRDRFGFPVAWSLSHYENIDYNTHESRHNVNFNQVNIPAEAYDGLQLQLEQKIKESQDKTFLYFAHLELAKLYANKAQQNALSPYEQKSKKQTRAALALQTQAPFKAIRGPLTFTPFIFRAQVDESTGVNGEYGYKLFRVNSAGKVKLKAKTLLDWIDVQADALRSQRNYQAITRGFNNGVNNYPNSNSQSPSGTYQIALNNERNNLPTEVSAVNLLLHNNGKAAGADSMPPVLDTGNPVVLGWHTQKDLFYFMVDNYQSRDCNLWQFDPKTSRFLKIGNTNKMVYLSPDGNWIIWGDGGSNGQNQMTTGLNAFNLKKGVNYRITHSFEPKYFIGWDTTPK